jgi:hypothetical protein
MIAVSLTASARADYWADYQACLVAQGTLSPAACLLQTHNQQVAVANLATTLTLVAAQPCSTATTRFLGNGISIDRASCGRRSCGGANPQLCATPPDRPSPAENPPLYVWSRNACEARDFSQGRCTNPVACLTCQDRPDSVPEIERNVAEQLAGLDRCFTRTYPNRALKRAIFRALSEEGGTHGIHLTCPSNSGDDKRNGDTDPSTGEIRIYPPGMSSEHTIGHEVMHLTQASATSTFPSIDNQNTDTHNNPEAMTLFTSGTIGVPGVPTGAPRAAQNQRFDRIISCTQLCFPYSPISQEECSICLSYPAAPGSGHSLPAPCRNMVTRAELAELDLRKKDVEEKAASCAATYATEHQAFASTLVSFTPRTDGTSGLLVFRGGLLMNRMADCVTSTYQNAIATLNDIIAAHPADPRNLRMLLEQREKYALHLITFTLRTNCDMLADIRAVHTQCYAGAGRDPELRSLCFDADARLRREKTGPTIHSLNDGIADWNRAAGELNANGAPGAAGVGATIQTLSASGQAVCSQIPDPEAREFVINVRGGP